MTPFQGQVLDFVKKLNAAEFEDWFQPSSVLAFCQVESAFKPNAYRYEPAIHDSSYGLMQVLTSTAREHGFTGAAQELYDPETALLIGMRVARHYWDLVERRVKRQPTYEEWCDSYNRGPGGASLGSPDHAYVHLWTAAKAYWKAQGVDA